MRKPVLAAVVAGLAVLVFAASASAHARMSPSVSLANELQLYSLAIPTEKENAYTTKIVLTLPKGFSIDSFVPNPGWKRVEQSTGSGDNAVITQVTWTGGHVPTEEDSLFQFLAQPAKSGHVHLPCAADLLGRLDRRLGRARVGRGARADDQGRQLGRRRRHVDVDDRRARARRARPARRRHRRVLARRPVADVRLRGRGSSSRSPPPGWHSLLPAAAAAHAYLVKTVPAASVILNAAPASVQLTYDEAVEPRFAIISVTDVDAQPGDDRGGHTVAVESGHARRAAQARRRGLVSRLLARDLGRRASGTGRVHLRGRPERGPGAAVHRSRTSREQRPRRRS